MPERNWIDESAERLGKADSVSVNSDISFIISKESAAKIAWCKLLSSCVGVLNIQLSENATHTYIQIFIPINASEDDKVKEIYQWQELTVTQKPTYTIIKGNFNIKVRKNWLEVCWTVWIKREKKKIRTFSWYSWNCRWCWLSWTINDWLSASR